MWVPIVAAISVVSLVALALRHRRGYLRELPMNLWGHDFADARSVAAEVAKVTGLAAEQKPAGLAWLGDFFLSPVWIFWGDLRTMRPERRLERWRLGGARASGRTASIQLGPDEAQLAIACTARGAFWVDARRPLDDQEGLRRVHPVGSPRWREATAHITALAGRGAQRLVLEDEALVCTLAMDEHTPAVTTYPSLLDELEALAGVLEA